jgi:hypothetical protein
MKIPVFYCCLNLPGTKKDGLISNTKAHMVAHPMSGIKYGTYREVKIRTLTR